MLYLSGSSQREMLTMPHANLGVMISPHVGYWRDSLDLMWWAGDNGRFKAAHKWTEPRWLAWMQGLVPYQARCLFMVAPDVLADPLATYDLGQQYLAPIRALGYQAAYVSQDNADQHPLPWDSFDCLFIGGTTAWKLSERSYALAAEAKQRAKWVHMGRVNGLRRLQQAQVAGVDSADGTYIAHEPSWRIAKTVEWLTTTGAQPPLLNVG